MNGEMLLYAGCTRIGDKAKSDNYLEICLYCINTMTHWRQFCSLY